MPGYENYEGKVCQAIISEDGSFYLLDPNRILINDLVLLSYFKTEIDYWELGGKISLVFFIYSVKERGNPEAPFVGHEHEFERIQSNVDVPKKKIKRLFSHNFQTMENFHKCKICGFIYKLTIKKFL